MRKAKTFSLIAAVVVAILLVGCASGPKLFDEKKATDRQKLINAISDQYPIPVGGKELVIKFADDVWKATVDGKDNMLGTCVFEETNEGTNIALTPTHVWSDQENPVTKKPVGWVSAPAPGINLVYTEGPPVSLSLK
jgi:hypothetical protein